MVAIDASVTLAWCFADEASPGADAALERLESEDAIAPAHWPLEVANALRTRSDLDDGLLRLARPEPAERRRFLHRELDARCVALAADGAKAPRVPVR